MAVRHASGASASFLPESLVMHASLELQPVLASQYDRKRTEFVIHALEIIPWAQTYEDNEKRAPRSVKAAVAAATATARTDTRVCNICSTVGHIARTCPSRPKNEDDEETPRWALAGIVAGCITEEDSIVDSGASAHLVKHSSMLYAAGDATRQARLREKVDGETHWIELRNFNHAPKMAINLISLGTLMLQGCNLAGKNNRHAVMIDDDVVMYFHL
uniref:CCHC-type domain-containing protein n=1 Tax=Peronospora matthiolae TaxID=2874970 RepID=A0AAV1SX86_9STRA